MKVRAGLLVLVTMMISLDAGFAQRKLQPMNEKSSLVQTQQKQISTLVSAQNKPTEEGDPLACKIYQELMTHPDLKDFPVVVSKIENQYATLVGVEAAKWAQAHAGRGLSDVFGMIETHRAKAKAAQGVANRITGKDTAWREYTEASESQVRQWAEEGMRKACIKM